jgi:hypothetical protein
MDRDLIRYENLGNEEIGGTTLDELIETLNLEVTSTLMCSNSLLKAFIIGNDNMMHPVFAEDCALKKPLCLNRKFSPKRLPRAVFDKYALDIYIVDQYSGAAICHLCYNQDALDPRSWLVFDDFYILRSDIGPFILLAHRIQNASLSDLLD